MDKNNFALSVSAFLTQKTMRWCVEQNLKKSSSIIFVSLFFLFFFFFGVIFRMHLWWKLVFFVIIFHCSNWIICFCVYFIKKTHKERNETGFFFYFSCSTCFIYFHGAILEASCSAADNDFLLCPSRTQSYAKYHKNVSLMDAAANSMWHL